MNRDDIIKMAQKCDLIGTRPHLDSFYVESVERFAALVAAAEREACAKVCEAHHDYTKAIALNCATAIRARGQQ